MNFVELCQMWGGVEVGDAVLAWLCWSPWCGWEPIVFFWYPQVLSYPSSFSSELLSCAHVSGESLCLAHPEAQRDEPHRSLFCPLNPSRTGSGFQALLCHRNVGLHPRQHFKAWPHPLHYWGGENPYFLSVPSWNVCEQSCLHPSWAASLPCCSSPQSRCLAGLSGWWQIVFWWLTRYNWTQFAFQKQLIVALKNPFSLVIEFDGSSINKRMECFTRGAERCPHGNGGSRARWIPPRAGHPSLSPGGVPAQECPVAFFLAMLPKLSSFLPFHGEGRAFHLYLEVPRLTVSARGRSHHGWVSWGCGGLFVVGWC